MITGIIARTIAVAFLLFNMVIFIGAAIQSVRQVMEPPEDEAALFSVVFMLLSLVFAVWVWGMLSKVVKKDWPRKLYIHLKTEWRKYAATALILIGLALLFGSPIGFYASIGHMAGARFAGLAQQEFMGLLGMELPSILLKLVAWTFQWHFAAFMVGFCVWIYSAVAGAVKANKKSA